MFDRMLWQDNVRDPARTYKATQNADGTTTMEPAGKLMQKGTNQSAENFNRMEDAIQDSQIAQQIIFQHQLQFEADHEERVSGLEAENIVETGTVTLTNTLKSHIQTKSFVTNSNICSLTVRFPISRSNHCGRVKNLSAFPRS